MIEHHFKVSIQFNDNFVLIYGDNPDTLQQAEAVLTRLIPLSKNSISEKTVYNLIHEKGTTTMSAPIHLSKKAIIAKNDKQAAYLKGIDHHDITFAVGPAGTGKTYLAVSKAIESFEKGEVHRLIFVRPAVEAGEKLGFLPGDLVEKILPYLRPIYDALYEMIGFKETQKMIQSDVIEVLPLAFMRGRTLNESFIILDEAQNTTIMQMKMFLTRIGFGSKAVVTGDVTQIDLPKGTESGLIHAVGLLKKIPEIGIHRFTSQEVVRHPLISRIIDSYDQEFKKS